MHDVDMQVQTVLGLLSQPANTARTLEANSLQQPSATTGTT